MRINRTWLQLRWMALLAALPGSVMMSAQDLDKEIVVVKPYQPALSDAFKINVLPRISDSISIRPDFDYSITPKKYDTHFKMRPITPARLVGVPLKKLYRTQLKLGFGNYLTPLAELKVNSLRSDRSQWGIALRHYSINGRLKLANDVRVEPGLMENSLSLNGKRIMRKHYLSAALRTDFDAMNFYGYHPSLDTVLSGESVRQQYLKADVGLRFGSMHRDSLHLNYRGGLWYQYTGDHFGHMEHAIRLHTELDQHFRRLDNTIGLKVDGAYYHSSEGIDSLDNAVFSLEPWMGRTTGEYTWRLGLDLTLDFQDDKLSPHFFPEAYLQINVVPGILVPFFGADGKLQVNSYRAIVEENPYITPGLKVDNTSHKIRGYVGLKGNFSERLSYHLEASYALVNKMPFYVNDTSTVLANNFVVDYDNVERVRIHAETRFQQSTRLQFLLSGFYDHFSMNELSRPWHRPAVRLSLDGQYNIYQKILLDMGIHYLGRREAPGTPLDPGVVSLPGLIDFNVGIEYRYTKILSAFLRFNNILGARDYLWNQYPGTGFQVMGGFTYAL